MLEIKNIVAYFCKNYPHRIELYQMRIVGMVYLADLEYFKQYKERLTNVTWKHTIYGADSDEIFDELHKNKTIFDLNTISKIYKSNIGSVKLNDIQYSPKIEYKYKRILDRVIDITEKLYYNAFKNYIYNTYPMKNAKRDDVLKF